MAVQKEDHVNLFNSSTFGFIAKGVDVWNFI